MSETKAKAESFTQTQRQKKLQSIFLQNRKTLEKKHSIRQFDEVAAYLDDKPGTAEVPRRLLDQLLHPTQQHFPGATQIQLLANLCDVSGARDMRDLLQGCPREWTAALLRSLFDPKPDDTASYSYCTLENIILDFQKAKDLRPIAEILKLPSLMPGFFGRGYPWEFQLHFLRSLAIFLTQKLLPVDSDEFRLFLFELNSQAFDRPEFCLARIQIVVQILIDSQNKLDILSISDRAFREAITAFNQSPWPEETELIAIFKLISIAVTEFGDPSKLIFFITQEIDFERTLGLFLRSTVLQRTLLAFYTNVLTDIPSVDSTPVVAKVARKIYGNSLTLSFQGNLTLKYEAVLCLKSLLYRTSNEAVEKELGDAADVLRCVVEQLRVQNPELSKESLELLECACLRFGLTPDQLARESELHEALHKASLSKDLGLAEAAGQILLTYFK